MSKKHGKSTAPHEGFASDDDYKVGPGRPPRHSRFQKGRSGNPKGRPKGSLNFKTMLQDNLGKIVHIREDGQLIEVTAGEAVMMKMFHLCLSGDHKACAFILEKCEKHSTTTSDMSEDVSEDDAKILERAMKRKASNTGSG